MNKLIYSILGIGLIISSIFYFSNKYIALKQLNLRLLNNIEVYQNLDKENVVLLNTVKELKNTNDSLLGLILHVAKVNKIKPKQIIQSSIITLVIRDTLRDTIIINKDSCNFSTTIKPNKETEITVNRIDSIVTVIPNISNTLTIIVYNRRKYKYNTFFKRLIHLNFSKRYMLKYEINNSNPIIKQKDIRVINIVK